LHTTDKIKKIIKIQAFFRGARVRSYINKLRETRGSNEHGGFKPGMGGY
jgi:hypothetical protein